MAGRPKTGKNFIVRNIGLTPEQDAWLDETATAAGVSRSDIVRIALNEYRINQENQQIETDKAKPVASAK